MKAKLYHTSIECPECKNLLYSSYEVVHCTNPDCKLFMKEFEYKPLTVELVERINNNSKKQSNIK